VSEAHRDRAALAQWVAAACRLEGQFVLRSGHTETTYFDKYLFEADPRLLHDIATALAHLVPEGTEILAGLELGGIPIVTALSLETGLPAAFVRKNAKTYGTGKLAEGADVQGRRTLVVEDVVTTGGQVVVSADALRQRGANLVGVLCVIDRSDGANDLAAAGLQLRSLFTPADLGTAS
jgi:orotate phosphoribosyltransferase